MNGRAKTEDQKKEIIARLYAVWAKNPELRLGQLLSIVVESHLLKLSGQLSHRIDLYGVEDFPLIEKIESILTEGYI